jgi:ABC-type sugar transport system ATPase subunit
MATAQAKTVSVPPHGDVDSANRPRPSLLRVASVTKTFPGLIALDNVCLDVHAGEIVALVGQNGSGKSTLVKILAGVYEPDGTAIIEGPETAEGHAAPELRFIHQDLGLVASLNTIENLDIGRQRNGRGLRPLRHRREADEAAQTIARFGGTFDVQRPISELAPAERAIVAISRALEDSSTPNCVLVLDEPTAALPRSDIDRLFEAVRRAAEAGAGVIFISHHLDEVMQISDRVVALRDGKIVADVLAAEIDHHALVSLIVGQAVAQVKLNHHSEFSQTALTVSGLSAGNLDGVDLNVGRGEIVGISGLLGSGRDELAGTIFGARSRLAGSVIVDAEDVSPDNPKASIDAGIAFVPAERSERAAVMSMSVRENLTLADLAPVRRRLGWMDRRAERAECRHWMDRVKLRPPLEERPLDLFSGGNQQKVVLAKWLRLKPKLLLLDEPTQGVDVGAKAAIYDLLAEAAAEGTTVLISSSDTKELAVLCDRVLVLRDGRVGSVLRGAEITEARLLQESLGLGASDPCHSDDPRGADVHR